jgi:cob(I)alamin adenosyltransferase
MSYRLSKITTRTGDNGTTGLGDGSRVEKHHLRIQVIGEVDELNSYLGVLLAETLPEKISAALLRIQHDLFDLGGELSIPGFVAIHETHIERLDAWLAEYNAVLPPLKNFVLPSGSRAAALAHVVRTVARRAERSLCALGAATVAEEQNAVSQAARHYLNRLSDFMFVLARTLNQNAGQGDVLWQQANKKDS